MEPPLSKVCILEDELVLNEGQKKLLLHGAVGYVTPVDQ